MKLKFTNENMLNTKKEISLFENEKHIFRPTFRSVFTLIISITMFGFFSYNLIENNLIMTNNSISIIEYIIIGFFTLLLIMSIYYILKIKIIVCDINSLIIKYPLLFTKLTFSYNQISKVEHSPQIIKSSTRGGIITVYKGKRITLNFDNKNSLAIDSFQTKNFDEFLVVLKKRRKTHSRKSKSEIKREKL